QCMRLDVEDAAVARLAQLGPGHEAGLADAGRDREQHPAKAMLLQQRKRDGVRALPGVVERQRNRPRAGTYSTDHVAGDLITRDGAVAVLGEVPQAGLEPL